MKHWVFYQLKNYLGFTKRESRGFMLVLPALLVLYLIPSAYDYLMERKHQEVYQSYLKDVELRWSELNSGDRKKVAENISLAVASREARTDTAKQPKKFATSGSSELNKINFAEADSIVLQIVPGIGTTLAGRIVRFRESMGGLHSQAQLLDVYGLSEDVVERIFTYFEFTPSIKGKLNLNNLDVKELSSHPYINYGQAKVIVAYREQHGDYQKPEDLLQIKIFTTAWLDKLKPYLAFR